MNSLCPNLKDSIMYLHYFIDERLLRIVILSNHKLEYGNENCILPGIISGNEVKSDIKFSGTVWKYIYWIENPVVDISSLTIEQIQVMDTTYNDVVSKIVGIDIPYNIHNDDLSENKIDKDNELENHYIYIDFDSVRDESYLNGKYKLNEDFTIPYQLKFVNGSDEYPKNYVVVRFKEHSMKNMSILKQYEKI